MENPPFEDVFPIQDGDFPLLCLFTGGYPVKSVFFQFAKAGSSENQPSSTAKTPPIWWIQDSRCFWMQEMKHETKVLFVQGSLNYLFGGNHTILYNLW